MVNGKQVTLDYLTQLTDEIRIKKVYVKYILVASHALGMSLVHAQFPPVTFRNVIKFCHGNFHMCDAKCEAIMCTCISSSLLLYNCVHDVYVCLCAGLQDIR